MKKGIALNRKLVRISFLMFCLYMFDLFYIAFWACKALTSVTLVSCTTKMTCSHSYCNKDRSFGFFQWSNIAVWFFCYCGIVTCVVVFINWSINIYLNFQLHTKENHFYSSSDSDSEDDEPRKFHVEIKPVQPNNSSQYTMPSLDELKESIGNITLSPAVSVSIPLLQYI